MTIHVASPRDVRRLVLRRLPGHARPLLRRSIFVLATAGSLMLVVAGLRLSAPVGPTVASGPILSSGALAQRPIELIAPGFLLYPERLRGEEGWLEVAGRHGGADRRQVRVHFTQLPMDSAPDAAAAAFVPVAHASAGDQAPIVYIADSRQGSSTAHLAGDGYAALQVLRTIGPVIAFDGRDSAWADPAPHCPGDWSIPPGTPLSRAALSRQLAPAAHGCAQAAGQVFAGVRFDLGQSVEDLDALRAALGVERLRLLAAGDGTRLALAYLQRHPQRVERALLLGPQLPERAAPRAPNVEDALGRALAALDADPHWSRRLPEPRESLRAAIARLGVQPVVQHTRDPLSGERLELRLGGADLRLAVLHRLAQRDGLQQLARLLEPTFRGDWRELAKTSALLRRQPAPRVGVLARQCALAAPSRSDSRAARRERMAAAFTLLGDAADLWRSAACAGWPEREHGPTADDALAQQDASEPAGTQAPPVLLVAGLYDTEAPLEQVEQLARTLPGAEILRIADSAAALHLHGPTAHPWIAALRKSSPPAEATTAAFAFLHGSPATDAVASMPLALRVPGETAAARLAR